MTAKKSNNSGNDGTRTVNKSAATGRFVSDKQVAAKPRETYKQTVPTATKPRGK